MQNEKRADSLKTIAVAALILAVAALVIATAAYINMEKNTTQSAAESGDIQYVLYLGTNGKDSNEPVFTPEEAQRKADEILAKHFGGFTIQEARGGWADGDTIYHEYTLVIYLSDTTSEKVHAAADELIQTFDQSSVLIQCNATKTEFYSGK